MRRYIADARFQARACEQLADIPPEMVAKVGGVEAIIEAMRVHVADALVQEQGCWALLALSDNYDRQNTIIAGGGVEAIIRAMDTYPGLETLQQHACAALNNLCVLVEGLERTVKAGGLPVLVAAMRVLAADPVVQHYGCWALLKIASVPSFRVCAADAGAIEAVARAMSTHSTNAELQSHGIWALLKIAVRSQDKVRVARAGGIDAIIKALRTHSRNKSVLENACWSLGEMADDDEAGAMWDDLMRGGRGVEEGPGVEMLGRNAQMVADAGGIEALVITARGLLANIHESQTSTDQPAARISSLEPSISSLTPSVTPPFSPPKFSPDGASVPTAFAAAVLNTILIAITNIVRQRAPIKVHAAKTGCIGNILAIMDTLTPNAETQWLGSRALHHIFALSDVEGADYDYATNLQECVQAVLRAMSTHIGNEAVQLHGCDALASLLVYSFTDLAKDTPFQQNRGGNQGDAPKSQHRIGDCTLENYNQGDSCKKGEIMTDTMRVVCGKMSAAIFSTEENHSENRILGCKTTWLLGLMRACCCSTENVPLKVLNREISSLFGDMEARLDIIKEADSSRRPRKFQCYRDGGEFWCSQDCKALLGLLRRAHALVQTDCSGLQNPVLTLLMTMECFPGNTAIQFHAILAIDTLLQLGVGEAELIRYMGTKEGKLMIMKGASVCLRTVSDCAPSTIPFGSTLFANMVEVSNASDAEFIPPD